MITGSAEALTMCLQPTQQRSTTGKPLNHGFTTKMIVTLMLQLACLQLLLQSQQQSQHMGVYGQITDPSTVQIGDTVWYVLRFFASIKQLPVSPPKISHALHVYSYSRLSTFTQHTVLKGTLWIITASIVERF